MKIEKIPVHPAGTMDTNADVPYAEYEPEDNKNSTPKDYHTPSPTYHFQR